MSKGYMGSAPEIGAQFRTGVIDHSTPRILVGWSTLHSPPRYPNGDRPLNDEVEAALTAYKLEWPNGRSL